MPFIPVPETVLVEMRMGIHGQKVENTLYFQRSGGWNTAGATTLANDLLIWWTTLLSVVLSTQIELVEIAVSDLDVVDSFQVVVPSPAPRPTGGAPAEALPNNVSLAVSFRTGRRGRSFRGRNYIVGIPETAAINSQVTSAFAIYIQGSYQGIPSAVSSSGGVWGVASRFNNNAPRTVGVFTPITSVTVVDDVIDSQRRRLPGRGQ